MLVARLLALYVIVLSWVFMSSTAVIWLEPLYWNVVVLPLRSATDVS